MIPSKPLGVVLDLCAQFFNPAINVKGHYFLRDLCCFHQMSMFFVHLRNAEKPLI